MSRIIDQYPFFPIYHRRSNLFPSTVLSFITTLNNILIDEHDGFRPERFIVTCNTFTTFYKYIYDAFSISNGSQIDVIYIDFVKAFDSVNHDAFLSLLESIGLGFPLLSWFR